MDSQVQEWAQPGKHDFLWRVLQPILGSLPCPRVVDVGCGPGAFISRFSSENVHRTACDQQGDLGQSSRCEVFCEGNLNSPDVGDVIRKEGQFGLACAIEIIEHLENPWQFMRMLNSILEPGGYCLISTPNNQDEASRVDMLTHGELPWFKLDGIPVTKHITPIFLQPFYLMMQQAGFELVTYYAFGKVPRPRMNWKGRLVRQFMRDRIMNEPGLDFLTHIWLLKKSRDVTERRESVTQATLAEAARLSQIPPKWTVDA